MADIRNHFGHDVAPWFSDIVRLLASLDHRLHSLHILGERIMTISQDLADAVGQIDTVKDSVITFIEHLTAQLSDMAQLGDVTQIQAAITTLKTDAQKLSDAVVNNTPSAPSGPSTPTQPPVDPSAPSAPQPPATDPNAPTEPTPPAPAAG